jgi:hypothetical protein
MLNTWKILLQKRQNNFFFAQAGRTRATDAAIFNDVCLMLRRNCWNDPRVEKSFQSGNKGGVDIRRLSILGDLPLLSLVRPAKPPRARGGFAALLGRLGRGLGFSEAGTGQRTCHTHLLSGSSASTSPMRECRSLTSFSLCARESAGEGIQIPYGHNSLLPKGKRSLKESGLESWRENTCVGAGM